MAGDKKLNIAFIWYFDKAGKVFDDWHDGLRAAIQIIEKKHNVSWFIDKTIPDSSDKFDFILFWDDSNSEFFNLMDRWDCPKGICLTTNPTNADNIKKLDVVFAESSVVRNEVASLDVRVYKAFGTDTDFFKPDPKKVKDIEYFYPATFSPWKRQSELSDLGHHLYLVGTMQPDGIEEYQKCINKGCHVELGYFPVRKIRNYFQRAKAVPIPAIHGSERTVLEAMSTDILPTVIHPATNKKAFTYIHEYHEGDYDSPRDFVLKNYSHKIYAKTLLKGIKEAHENYNNNADMGN